MKQSRVPNALRAQNGLENSTAAAYREALRRYAGKPWVTGVMISLREKDGRLDLSGGPVIAIHVRKKVGRRSVVGSRMIPGTILGVPTDVVEVNTETSDSLAGIPTVFTLPLCPGRSIGRETVGSAGTLGAIVRNVDGDRCLLTARHVLFDGGSRTKKVKIVHPGPVDAVNATTSQVVAHVTKTHQGADAGVARLVPQTLTANNLAGGGTVLIGPPEEPTLGSVVNKSGRTTGDTQAIIQGWGTAQLGVYPALLLRGVDGAPGKGWDAGDSGSVWFDAFSSGAIGLHVGNAAGATADYAIATQLTYIVEQLDLTWV